MRAAAKVQPDFFHDRILFGATAHPALAIATWKVSPAMATTRSPAPRQALPLEALSPSIRMLPPTASGDCFVCAISLPLVPVAVCHDYTTPQNSLVGLEDKKAGI
jgi:hypothetical protein